MAPEEPFQFVRAGKLHFFCPLCKYHQSTSTIQKVEAKHYFQLGILTLAITLLTYPVFGLKGLSLYLVFWAVFEFFYRLRKRQALVCQSCGFDPFLYKQDVHRARKALREHWETRITNENLFANLKLKNYQTARVKSANEPAENNDVNPSEALKNPESLPTKSP
ncbi:MAG TPA: hypothetical protein VIH99_12495 [Bdellovibrionota bacterium]